MNKIYVNDVDYGGGGSSGGTSDYAELTNKPKINNVTLNGDKTAKVTPDGTVSTPTISITGTQTGTVKSLKTQGTLPSFSYDSGTEELTLDFGALPTSEDVTVVTDVGSASSSQPTFTGTETNVTIS